MVSQRLRLTETAMLSERDNGNGKEVWPTKNFLVGHTSLASLYDQTVKSWVGRIFSCAAETAFCPGLSESFVVSPLTTKTPLSLKLIVTSVESSLVIVTSRP